jgi:hypothetical protein
MPRTLVLRFLRFLHFSHNCLKVKELVLYRQSELTFISYSSMTSETSPINLLVLYFRPRFFVAWLRRPYLTLHENITTSQHR